MNPDCVSTWLKLAKVHTSKNIPLPYEKHTHCWIKQLFTTTIIIVHGIQTTHCVHP